MEFPDKNQLAAAIDLGSNSFHMVIAASEESGLRVVDRIKERIYLANGLDEQKQLSEESVTRALLCLERFQQRLEAVSTERIRAVGTNTFRVVRTPHDFLAQAEQSLGQRIEILSGEEEARLIYRGVRYDLGQEGHLLDIDIGGGSTEIVCGDSGTNPHCAESLSMGSSSWNRRYFDGGKISKRRFKKAVLAALHELEPVRNTFRKHTLDRIVASSGTALALRRILESNSFSKSGLTLEGLKKLRHELLEHDNLDEVKLNGLKDTRRPTFLGGLSIMIALMDGLEIPRLQTSETALREGLLQNLLGRLTHKDAREQTVSSMIQRYSVDIAQAKRVEGTADDLFQQVKKVWDLGASEQKLLGWAAQLHEVGLAVRHTGYHRHGAYLVQNSDLPGFSRTDTDLLAFMIRHHRQKFHEKNIDALPRIDRHRILCLTLLLRLAAHLHRTRQSEDCALILTSQKTQLHLRFPEGWLEQNALTQLNLQTEKALWEECSLSLTFS